MLHLSFVGGGELFVLNIAALPKSFVFNRQRNVSQRFLSC